MYKFLGLLLIPTLSFASVKVDLSQAPSGVEFLAVGKPSALKINGTGGKLAGTIEVDGTEIKGRILVKINDFSTGISLRDQHMKEKYLETEKFSDAWLEIKKIELDRKSVV